MSSRQVPENGQLREALRCELLRLASAEDLLATKLAARVPYWDVVPDSVTGHREAARVLRADAESFA